MGLRTVGFICDEPPTEREPRLRILGGFDRFRTTIPGTRRDAGHSSSSSSFQRNQPQVIATCDQLGVRLLIVSDLEKNSPSRDPFRRRRLSLRR
jgi:hypothetical protein